MTVIAFASDHAGRDLRLLLLEVARKAGWGELDLGPDTSVSVDYPDYGYELARVVAETRCKYGIAVCGSGIGISIACNRHPGVRAALCHDVTTARLARAHNDANILALGARVIGSDVAQEAMFAFLETPFEGGRHQRRVDKLTAGQPIVS